MPLRWWESVKELFTRTAGTPTSSASCNRTSMPKPTI